MNIVLDAGALIAYLADEPGADIVDRLLSDTENVCLAHALNICEVYYHILRLADEQTAISTVEALHAAGITIREEMDAAIWRQAGGYKAELRRVSLADCFCMALAVREDADIVTADHHEFDEIARRGLCRVIFIR